MNRKLTQLLAADVALKLDRHLTAIENSTAGEPAYLHACYGIYELLPAGARETLMQLVRHGPVYDGDIVSKTSRDLLMEIGLASRAIVSGEQGYTVSTYRGWRVAASQNVAESLKPIKGAKRWRLT